MTEKAEYLRRWSVLLAGLVIMAVGVALAIRGGLGISPISSLPYVMSLFLPLTVGELTIIVSVGLVLLQVLLLRRRYRPLQLLQLPAAIAFGYLTDGALWLTKAVVPAGYLQQWGLCLAGIYIVGVGVCLEVKADVVPLPGEGTVLALCQVIGLKFGTMKVLFDVTLVASAAALSLIFMQGLYGVREGTAAAALLVGTTARLMDRLLEKPLNRFISWGKAPQESGAETLE